MMETACVQFESFVSKLKFNKMKIPITSTVTGKLLLDSECSSPSYWAGHIRSTVRFYPAIENLKQNLGSLVLLEVGPRTTLNQLSTPVLGKIL